MMRFKCEKCCGLYKINVCVLCGKDLKNKVIIHKLYKNNK